MAKMKLIVDKGDGPMNKDKLLKKFQNASRGNFFSIEVPKATKEDENKIEELVAELEKEGKIKLRECVQREYSVYLHGIIKYASE
ncbi:putative transcriptional regulator [Bacillus fengqiuensis]|nr:putative transcriptional regulator [Bacillus fengqiuensis]